MTSEAAPTAKPSSAAPRPRRPWYMVAALLAAWIFGSNATMQGWTELSLFKNGSLDDGPSIASSAAGADKSPEAQAVDDARHERLVDALFVAKKRMVPLGIASFILGLTMWTFAVGAMAGRRGGRRILVQVVMVHGALAVVTYILTPDVRRVEIAIGHEIESETTSQQLKDLAIPQESMDRVRAAETHIVDAAPAIALALVLLGHLGIVVALTRKRTLAFYELAGS